MRVVIVEDDGKIASFVQRGLEEAGYHVDRVADAEGAVPLLVTGEYDAAVVDIMLPGMDGLSMIETLRECGEYPIGQAG